MELIDSLHIFIYNGDPVDNEVTFDLIELTYDGFKLDVSIKNRKHLGISSQQEYLRIEFRDKYIFERGRKERFVIQNDFIWSRLRIFYDTDGKNSS